MQSLGSISLTADCPRSGENGGEGVGGAEEVSLLVKHSKVRKGQNPCAKWVWPNTPVISLSDRERGERQRLTGKLVSPTSKDLKQRSKVPEH